MMYNKISYIDANVLLEAVLPNRLSIVKAREFMERNSTTISPLTVHLLTYFGAKYKVDLDTLLRLIKQHRLTDLGPAEVNWAITYRESDDFEDALQVACAVMSGCKEFVTLDKQLAKLYGKHIKMRLL